MARTATAGSPPGSVMSCPFAGAVSVAAPPCEPENSSATEQGMLSVPRVPLSAEEYDALIALQPMDSVVSNTAPVPAHPTLRPRNLCLFFDGTGNAAFLDQITNVATLFSLASHCDEAQLVYYQTGIGTPLARPSGMQFWPQRAWAWISATIDKGIAFSLGAHVERGYAFLMNHWQPGDRIYLFGFSRGAFTARALAGMLQKVGLLPKGNEETIPLAYSLYKRAFDVPMGLSSRSAARAFKQKFCRKVEVHFIGVFDTVRSVGAVLPRTLPFASGAPHIHHFRQALALDERRAGYMYQPWIPAEGPLPLGHSVNEVFFSGAHSNIGGGEFAYDFDAAPALNHLPLRWMLREAVAAGFLLDPKRLRESPVFAARRTGKYPLYADRREVPLYELDEEFDPGCPTLVEYLVDLARSYPQSNQEVAELVYRMADQTEWRHDAACAPRGDVLSFRIKKRDPEAPLPAKKCGRVHDWFSRQGQRVKAFFWWLFEDLPDLQLVESAGQRRSTLKMRINRGRGRRLPPSPAFHYSVKDRMGADPEELARRGRGNNENAPEKRGYRPRARFQRGQTIENVTWVG